jgi:hypothetical protein
MNLVLLVIVNTGQAQSVHARKTSTLVRTINKIGPGLAAEVAANPWPMIFKFHGTDLLHSVHGLNLYGSLNKP